MSTPPPPRLPEQGEPLDENDPVFFTLRRGVFIALWLAALLLVVTLVGVTMLIIYEPERIGLEPVRDATRTAEAIHITALALETTATAFQSRDFTFNATATAIEQTIQANIAGALDNNATSAALNNRALLLDQTATGAAFNFAATQTAVAAANAQQATRGALDFQGTQAAFDQAATQAAIGFQGTQAALNSEATTIALGFITAPPLSGTSIGAPTPQPFDEGAVSGITAGLWAFSSPVEWGLAPDGAPIARVAQAAVLSQQSNLTDYLLEVALTPPAGPATVYVLLNIPLPGSGIADGLALELFVNEGRLTSIALYRGAVRAALLDAAEPSTVSLALVQGVAPDFPAQTLTVQVDMRGARVRVFASGQAVMDLTLPAAPPAGSVGLALPEDTVLTGLALLP